ncbi:xylose isomerase-like TIM barrel domain-containing protein [Sarocladium implicatum]|nr:xylose isomerase-like TIM barrel domain-containing protein [Sarocladium implicatum]
MAWQPAIMGASLGRAWLHDFDYKMEQASKAGFKGMEIFYEDLEYLARKLAGVSDASVTPTTEQLLAAARHAGQVCQKLNLEVIGLQPFLFYDGLKDREQHDRLIEKIKVWFQMAKLLNTATIQIPANFLPADQLTDDFDVIASDLRELADMGAKEEPAIRFAYENLCWSTRVDTWEKLWDVVKRVDRPNFGVCLDTFNIAGRVWADPESPTGKTPNADADLKASLKRMVAEVDMAKVFYIQVVDAERLDSPLVKGHPFFVEGNPARMNWSRNARLFMYEEDRGGYLPVEEVAKVLIHDMGFKGYVSMELFSRTMAEEGQHVPDEHAQRGMASWRKMVERLSLQ